MHICNEKNAFIPIKKVASSLKIHEVLLYTSKSFKRANLYALDGEI